MFLMPLPSSELESQSARQAHQIAPPPPVRFPTPPSSIGRGLWGGRGCNGQFLPQAATTGAGRRSVLNTKIFSYPAIFSWAATTATTKLSFTFFDLVTNQKTKLKMGFTDLLTDAGLAGMFLSQAAPIAIRADHARSAQQLASDSLLRRWVCCHPPPSLFRFLDTPLTLPFPDDPHGPCC